MSKLTILNCSCSGPPTSSVFLQGQDQSQGHTKVITDTNWNTQFVKNWTLCTDTFFPILNETKNTYVRFELPTYWLSGSNLNKLIKIPDRLCCFEKSSVNSISLTGPKCLHKKRESENFLLYLKFFLGVFPIVFDVFFALALWMWTGLSIMNSALETH